MTESASRTRWRTTSASVRGAAHDARGTVNEDAVDTLESAALTMIAVADGHGSDQSPRSERGSAFAIRAALDVAAVASVDLVGSMDHIAAVVDEIGQQIVARWRAAVHRDVGEHPLTDSETTALRGAPVEYAYGSTVLLAGCTSDVGFAVQLGDGHILLVDADGRGALAFEEKPGKAATETDSLCMDRANEYVHTRVWPLDGSHPLIITASTDGWGDAFENRRWFDDTARGLHEYLTTNGLHHVTRELRTWLARPAAEYGDDTTMAVLAAVDDTPTARAPVDTVRAESVGEQVPLPAPERVANAVPSPNLQPDVQPDPRTEPRTEPQPDLLRPHGGHPAAARLLPKLVGVGLLGLALGLLAGRILFHSASSTEHPADSSAPVPATTVQPASARPAPTITTTTPGAATPGTSAPRTSTPTRSATSTVPGTAPERPTPPARTPTTTPRTTDGSGPHTTGED